MPTSAVVCCDVAGCALQPCASQHRATPFTRGSIRRAASARLRRWEVVLCAKSTACHGPLAAAAVGPSSSARGGYHMTPRASVHAQGRAALGGGSWRWRRWRRRTLRWAGAAFASCARLPMRNARGECMARSVSRRLTCTIASRETRSARPRISGAEADDTASNASRSFLRPSPSILTRRSLTPPR